MSELCHETSLNPALSQFLYLKAAKKVPLEFNSPKSSAKNITMFGGLDLVTDNDWENITIRNGSHVRGMVMFIFSQYFDLGAILK